MATGTLHLATGRRVVGFHPRLFGVPGREGWGRHSGAAGGVKTFQKHPTTRRLDAAP